MKKNSKIFLALLIVLVMSVSITVLAGCGPKIATTAIQLEEAEIEYYAFAVHKGNDTLRTALDEFIALPSTTEALETSTAFHFGTSDKSIDYPDLSQFKGNGKIVMLTNATFPPYEYMNNTSAGSVGGVAGIDVDMMILFAASQKKTLEVKSTSFAAILVELKNDTEGNKIGAAGMTITDDRKAVVDFSAHYAQSILYLISDVANSYSSMTDLDGLVIGVQEGTTADIILTDEKNAGKKVTVKKYPSSVDAFLDLQNGKINAILLDDKPALTLVAENN